MKARLCLLLIGTLLLLLPALAEHQEPLPPLPPTREKIADLFGNEIRLYFALPDNDLVFIDTKLDRRHTLTLGPDERSNLMAAYLKACAAANIVQEDRPVDVLTIAVRDQQVTFKAARKEERSWVVLYVGRANEQIVRFAVPQLWDLKDPKLEALYQIKSGFERLLLKAGL